MARTVAEVMTTRLETVDASDSIQAAAERMRESNCGDVLVTQDGQIVGIVTDRDLVVRGLAAGSDPSTEVGPMATDVVQGIPATASVSNAAALMREKHVRRLPVVDNGVLVGIVSIGDLAKSEDGESVLAEISAAPANN